MCYYVLRVLLNIYCVLGLIFYKDGVMDMIDKVYVFVGFIFKGNR